MLFNYRYVTHSIEGLQVYMDHLVKEVWCKANGPFSLDLLHPELKLIVEHIANDDSITKDYLDGPIRRIYEMFRDQLTPVQRAQVSVWYNHNNDIEALCAGDQSKRPATYADIRAISTDLEAALKSFCKSLFTDVIHLKAVTSRIGELEAHYRAFVTENGEGKCPYCGCGGIKGVHHSRRDAYDHFLPKGTYPFNSVNFHNLAPMCHECNSTYKLTKDPTRHLDPISRKTGGTRRKAFYSYATVASCIRITMTLNTKDITRLQPDEIELQLTAPGREEEVEAWKDVFGIEERYKAKLCGKNDGIAWLQQVIEEAENVDLTPAQMLAAKLRSAENRPYADVNFLRKAFLNGCQRARII